MRNAFPWRADWHRIIREEPFFMDFLRRRFPVHAPHFFLYRHALNGAFVVAGWVHGPRGRMLDLMNLGSEPVLTRQHVEDLRLLLQPLPHEVLSSDRLQKIEKAQGRDGLRRALEDQDNLADAKGTWARLHGVDMSNPFYHDVRDRDAIRGLHARRVEYSRDGDVVGAT